MQQHFNVKLQQHRGFQDFLESERGAGKILLDDRKVGESRGKGKAGQRRGKNRGPERTGFRILLNEWTYRKVGTRSNVSQSEQDGECNEAQEVQ